MTGLNSRMYGSSTARSSRNWLPRTTTSTCRPSILVRSSGAAMPSISSAPSPSPLMYSSVLVAKSWSWAAMPSLSAVLASATVSAVWIRPFATTSSPVYSVSPCSRTSVPSLTLAKTSGPTSSSSGTPALISSWGPRFGYRPVMLGATFTTAPTCCRSSASAPSRARASWWMMAISPSRRRLVRFLVLRSSRAAPITPGRSSGLLRCLFGSFRNGANIAVHPARPGDQVTPHAGSGNSPGRWARLRLSAPVQPSLSWVRSAGRPARPVSRARSAGPGLRGRCPFRRGGGERLPPGRPAELGVLEAGQHPGQLRDPPGVVEPGHPAAGHAAVAGLLHHQVGVRERGDLGQVGDHDDLGQPGQPGQPPADLHRGLPAHPGVDLVEHEGRDGVRPREHHLDREHDPGQLTAGGALGQRQRRCPGVRGQPDRHLVRAVRAEVLLRRDRDRE